MKTFLMDENKPLGDTRYVFEIYHINEEKHNNNFIIIFSHYICSHIMLTALASYYLLCSLIGQKYLSTFDVMYYINKNMQRENEYRGKSWWT